LRLSAWTRRAGRGLRSIHAIAGCIRRLRGANRHGSRGSGLNGRAACVHQHARKCLCAGSGCCRCAGCGLSGTGLRVLRRLPESTRRKRSHQRCLREQLEHTRPPFVPRALEEETWFLDVCKWDHFPDSLLSS
jgi:hypothetical protein